jgi:calcium-dependent protein kinase
MFDDLPSPVFNIEKVRRTKGSLIVTSRYHTTRSLRQDYKVERHVLGSGASGPVHLAKRGTREYAVKSFRKRGLTPEAKAELRGEVDVYLKLDHPHVARLEDVYETERELHLVMELMSGGELYTRLAQRRHYSEADAAQTCRQMLLAVAYLHAHNIVHRDLKLENFLYERQDTEHLKLIDFGFAKYHERGSTKMSRSCGSLHYIAPEVLKHSYDEKADMWSIGVIVYMLLTGNPPFYGSTDEKCLARIQRGEPSFSKRWWKLSGGAQAFVMSLLVLDPESRPGAADALKQPWICMQDIETPKATLDNEVLASLRSFAQASHFRRACLSMMAWSLTLEDQAELRAQFQLLDSNKSGTITQHEFATVLQANFSIDSAETEALFNGLDTKGSKEISYAEFLAATMKKRMRMHEDVLHAAFERFDVEGKGEITPSNLRALLGDSFEGSDVEELIREADCDGDGRVSYADFLAYLQCGDAEEETLNASNGCWERQWTDESMISTVANMCAPVAVNEESRRFRATREFTEIIDSKLPAETSSHNARPTLTPRHPKQISPLKQRKCFSADDEEASTTTPRSTRRSTTTETPPRPITSVTACDAGLSTSTAEATLSAATTLSTAAAPTDCPSNAFTESTFCTSDFCTASGSVDSSSSDAPGGNGITIKQDDFQKKKGSTFDEEILPYSPVSKTSLIAQASHEGNCTPDNHQPRWTQCFKPKWPLWLRRNRA